MLVCTYGEMRYHTIAAVPQAELTLVQRFLSVEHVMFLEPNVQNVPILCFGWV